VAAEILADHAARIAALTIVPSSGGRFVIQVGEQTIFDKKAAGRFPEPGEAARLAGQRL
jgi:selenoprotein W-related protein